MLRWIVILIGVAMVIVSAVANISLAYETYQELCLSGWWTAFIFFLFSPVTVPAIGIAAIAKHPAPTIFYIGVFWIGLMLVTKQFNRRTP